MPPAHKNPVVVATETIDNMPARLTEIQQQAAALVAAPPYQKADVTSINDLLTKSQQNASAISDLAADLQYVLHFFLVLHDPTSSVPPTLPPSA